jgi:hypothetical protein
VEVVTASRIAMTSPAPRLLPLLPVPPLPVMVDDAIVCATSS